METAHIDKLLIEKCIAGDRSSQYRLYQKYSRGMYNVCARMVGDQSFAEDVLQESFVSVFRNMKSFKGDSTVGAWIKRIVVNTCIDHLRKKKMHFADIDDAYIEVAEESSSPDTNIQYDVQRVMSAMRKLPQGYKMIFSLYAVEGYDHEEIAEILDISVSTSKSQYHRAKKKLKELIMP